MTEENTDTADDETEENSSPWGDSVAPGEGSGPSSGSGPSGRSGTGASSKTDDNPFEQADPAGQSGSMQDSKDGSGTATGEASATTPPSSKSGPSSGTTPPPDSSASSSVGGTAESRSIGRDDAETNTAERDRPEEVDSTLGGAFGSRNYTQDLVDFEFVFDEDDSFTPDTVDSSGIVETPNGEYVGLAEVTARSWSIHTDQKKHEIIQSFQSGFLSTLDFYTQIVCYPTEFDMSEHITRLEERVREMGNSADEGDLIQIGRQLYPAWLTSFIRSNELTQRDYYVVVRVDPSDLRQFDETESLGDKVAERAEAFGSIVESIEGLFSSGDEDDGPEASREECIQEVHARLGQIKSALQQIDVDVEPVDDRDEALAVIYHYYNNSRPDRSSFDTGTRTLHDPNAPLDIDENQVDDLLRPNYEPNEEETET